MIVVTVVVSFTPMTECTEVTFVDLTLVEFHPEDESDRTPKIHSHILERHNSRETQERQTETPLLLSPDSVGTPM